MFGTPKHATAPPAGTQGHHAFIGQALIRCCGQLHRETEPWKSIETASFLPDFCVIALDLLKGLQLIIVSVSAARLFECLDCSVTPDPQRDAL